MPTSPIKALARRVAHIMQNTANQSTPLSAYFQRPRVMQHVYANDINKALKESIRTLNLQQCGFNATNVSSHSLRAGGAMAMKLNGIDCITIKKHGRWSSNTFMMYIHEQIGAVMAGVSTKMSTFIPFHNNLATGPTLIEPEDPLATPA